MGAAGGRPHRVRHGPVACGTVLAGRSLREVERQDNIVLVAAAAWLLMLGVLAVTALFAAWLWPRHANAGM